MLESKDSQNVQVEENIEMSSGTDPESSSDSDPGSPSDHGLPPTTTGTRKWKYSDDEDSDFDPTGEADSSERGVVSKSYAIPEIVKSLVRPQEGGSSAQGQAKPTKQRTRTIFVETRKATMFVDPHQAATADDDDEAKEEEQAPQPPPAKKPRNLMADAMPKTAPKPKPTPKGKGKGISTAAAPAKKKKEAPIDQEEEDEVPTHLRKLRPYLSAHVMHTPRQRT